MISVAVPDVRPSGSVEPSPLHIFITGLTGVNTPDKGQVPFQMARGTERERERRTKYNKYDHHNCLALHPYSIHGNTNDLRSIV